MKPRKLEFQEKADISSAIDMGELVAFNSTHNKEIILAIAKSSLDYREYHKSGSSSAKIRASAGQRYSIFYTSDNHLINLINIENEPFNIHEVQFLTNNKILLVCCRSRYFSKDKFDLNGRVYSDSGICQKSILLGDGINKVQVSKQGEIWTSYFDEGIFGNYGWNTPIGSSGLISWNEDGEKVYEFNPSEELEDICDCYAINVETKNVTWCYYYTQFPLVKIKNRSIENYWNIPIYGSNCFAIYRNFVLFHGGYHNKNYFYLLKLDRHHKANIEKVIEPVNIKTINRICSRGDTIFSLSEKKVYTISVWEAMNVS